MSLVEKIWASEQVTNCGPMHQELEQKLAAFLGVEHLALVANGTLALEAAMAALDVDKHGAGEVITSPFTFVATAHAIQNAGLKPVFADLQAGSPNLDPVAVRAAITPETKAIMPIHCYGLPCDVDAFDAISAETGIPIIYDAAHAFGVQHNGKSLLRYGDAATLSFHGTKVFNTFEGGCVVFATAEAKARCTKWRNFGYENETTIRGRGTNAKMNEVCAAMGLASLPHYETAHKHRALIDEHYRKRLADIAGITCLPPAANNAYFPIVVTADFPLSRDALYEQLVGAGIFARRYFYPLIPEFEAFSSGARSDINWPRADQLAKTVVCLPIHPELTLSQVDEIVSVMAAA